MRFDWLWVQAAFAYPPALDESSLLSVAAAAWVGCKPLACCLCCEAHPQDLPSAGEVRVDWHVMDLRVWRRIRYGIVFGLAPALAGSKAELRDALHESVGRASAGRATARLQRLLVISEVALSGVLL